MREWFKEIYTDWSAISLILSNLLVSFLAIKNHWSVLTLMWIFLMQGIIIITYKYLAIRNKYNKSKANIEPKKFKDISFRYNRISIICFTVFILILIGASLETAGITHKNDNNIKIFGQAPNLVNIIISTMIFLINHTFSFIYNKNRNPSKYRSEEDLYKDYENLLWTTLILRILPIDLSVVIGGELGASQATMIAFLAVKLIFDISGHTRALKVKSKTAIIN